jgi:outer membrane autotransporter protein
MTSKIATATLMPFLFAFSFPAAGAAQTLDSFAILAGSAITNTGPSVIAGNVGVSPSGAITGFPPAIVTAPFAIFQADAVASRAQSDLTTAYNVLAGRPATADLTGQDLGGLTLIPGVYSFSSSSQLTGTVTLDAKGDPNAVFIFNIGSTLTTGTASSVKLINGAQGANVYFRVGSSATLGAATLFAGKIFALTSITLVTGAEISCGSALARNGAVTLDTNVISVCALAAQTYGSGLGGPATANQAAVGAALDRSAAAGAVLPLSLQVLLGVLSPAELRAAMTQLSGEAGAGVAPVATQAMTSFLSLLMDAAVEDQPVAEVPPNIYPVPGSGTVRALGYAPDPALLAPRSPFGGLHRTPARAAPAPWRMWGAGYGGRSETSGDSLVGTHARSARAVGFAAGADYAVTPDTKIGFALGGGATHFSLADGLGGGRSDMFQAGLYSRTNFGNAYVASVIAYAWHDASTSRLVTLGGDQLLTGAFHANNVGGQIEAGYRLGWLVPYAALGVQAFATPSYREQPGASIFALGYEARTAVSARTQLGLRVDQVVAMDGAATLRLRARAAWVHDASPAPRLLAAFQAVPESTFTVAGASPARNALLLSAGPEVNFKNGLSAAATLDSETARGAHAYGGRGEVRLTW